MSENKRVVSQIEVEFEKYKGYIAEMPEEVQALFYRPPARLEEVGERERVIFAKIAFATLMAYREFHRDGEGGPQA